MVIEDLNVAGLMRGAVTTEGPGRCSGMGDIKRQLIYKGQWRHTRVTLASPMVSQQQDLQRLRQR